MVRQHFPMPVITRLTIVMLFWILFLAIMYEFRNFLYPLGLGVLFAYLFYPLASFFEKNKIPRILANLLSIIIGISVLYGLLIFIYRRLQEFMIDLPQLEKQALRNIETIFAAIENGIGLTTDPEEGEIVNLTKKLFETSSEGIQNTITATFNTFFSIFILPVYIFFFLYYRNKFKTFILKLIPEDRHDQAEDILGEINQVTVKYMTGIFIVVLILCVLNSVGLLIIGVKFAVLCGVLAAIANFIPYFGTIIGYSIPLIVALLTGESPAETVGVVILFIIIQFTENNILTPNIVGMRLRINPFFIIISVLFGGILWGIPGMFIIVPFMGMLKIIFDRIPHLRHWGYLIGDTGTEEYALNIRNIKRKFKIRG
ncbi:MAG: AI-2E family transporter [Bacteroidales bacterium]|nr:AI-2E family transporter [Bacteroidales bacterium]